jgi:hypothetical protein
MNESWEGGCLCGRVRFRASGAPKWTIWCHCQSCRKHSGAPVSAFAAFDETVVEVTKGEITKFASSPGVLRGFCSTCGSTLTCQGERSPDELHFHIGAFDRPERLAPVAEVYSEERLPWVCLRPIAEAAALQTKEAR